MFEIRIISKLILPLMLNNNSPSRQRRELIVYSDSLSKSLKWNFRRGNWKKVPYVDEQKPNDGFEDMFYEDIISYPPCIEANKIMFKHNFINHV